MTDNARISQLIDVFSELAELSGGLERTSIFPNLEVIDATPADLPAQYIIIQDQEGFYIPALKVPGITYNDGDLVNVLYIKGTEPIAFMQGSGSSGGGSSGGWPFLDVITVDATDTNADYTTITAALAAATGTQRITLGSNITETVVLNKTNPLVGYSQSVKLTSAATPTLDVTTAGAWVENISVVSVATGATRYAVRISAASTYRGVRALGQGLGTTSMYGFHNGSGGAAYLYDCEVDIPNGGASYGTGIYATGAGSTVDVFGGVIRAGTLGNAINAVSSGVIRLHGPIIESGATAGSGATGWYVTSAGDIVDLNITASRVVVTSASQVLSASTIPSSALNLLTGGIWRVTPGGTITQETSIANAQTNGADDDNILIWPGTYSITGLSLTKRLKFWGIGDPRNIIITSSDSFTFSCTVASITFTNLTINNTHASGTDGICVQWNVNNILFDSCLFTKSGAADDGACLTPYGGTGWQIINCVLVSSGATRSYGIWQNTAVTSGEVIGGSISGTTADIFSDQASTIILRGGVKLVNNLISCTGGATLGGNWIDNNGVMYTPESNDTFSPVTFRPSYIIQTSVASNDITVAIKTLDGADATSTNPIVFKIGNVVRKLTTAASITKNDGTNWMNIGAAVLAGQDIDLFQYAMWETGASAGLKFFFSRLPYGRLMSDFVNTTTSEKYAAGNWTNFNATDECVVIGRFNASLSATAAFNWSIPATSIIINYPIFTTRRLLWTSTVTALTGTITTVGTVGSSYKVVDDTLIVWQDITITTNGTGATGIAATIPFTPAGILTVSTGRASNGSQLQCYVQSTNSMTILKYDNTYPAGTGVTMYYGGVSIPLR